MEKPKLLVVEDEKVNRAILVHMLHEKYEVLLAENGLDAFDIMRKNKVDIILLDLFMPVMNGMEFLEKRKEYEDYSDIPVIVTTQERDPLIEANAFELGVKEFVIKPYNAIVLLKRIRDLLKTKEKEQDLQGVTVNISSTKLLDLMDNIPCAVAIFEVRGVIDFLYYNEGFSELLGYTAKELEEAGIEDPLNLIYEDDVDLLTHKINQSIVLGKNLNITVRAYTKEKTIIWLALEGQFYRDEHSFPQFYTMFRDVTAEYA